MFERSLDQEGIQPRILEFSSINGLRHCLHRGIGITLCPVVSVQRELAEKRLIALAWGQESLETTTLMIWHAEKWCSPLLKHFMQIAEAKIRPPG